MATVIKYINPNRRNIEPGEGLPKNIFVKAGDLEALIDQVNQNSSDIEDMGDGTYKFDHIAELTATHGITFDNKITVIDGTAADPGIVSTTGNAGIAFASGQIILSTAGVERVNIDGQGDINIEGGRGIEGGTAGGYFATFTPIAAQQALAGPGAVEITNYYTALTTTGTGDALTIGPGAVLGQLKKIKYVAEGAGADTAVLTPSVTTGFATCTFNAVGDYATFLYAGDGVNAAYWICIENSGCTLA
jgi:hypothetical protein